MFAQCFSIVLSSMTVYCFSVVFYDCPLFFHSPLCLSFVSTPSSMFVLCFSTVLYDCPLFLHSPLCLPVVSSLSSMFVHCFSIVLYPYSSLFVTCFSVVIYVCPLFLHSPLCLPVDSPYHLAPCRLHLSSWISSGDPNNLFFRCGVFDVRESYQNGVCGIEPGYPTVCPVHHRHHLASSRLHHLHHQAQPPAPTTPANFLRKPQPWALKRFSSSIQFQTIAQN